MGKPLALNRIIVVGASAGGVHALCALVQQLPENWAAVMFIVMHLGKGSVLPQVLSRCHGDGNIAFARNHEKIQAGRIYVAPPHRYMTITNSRIRLTKGPELYFHRWSVDALFHSAASAYGRRVIGIVLTGCLDDGASGMLSIKNEGGLAVVQDPAEARFPDMPLNAMRAASVDHCLPLAEIPPLLIDVARTRPHPVPH